MGFTGAMDAIDGLNIRFAILLRNTNELDLCTANKRGSSMK